MRLLAALVTLGMLPLASAAGGADPHAAKDPENLTWVAPGVLAVGGGGLDETQVDWLHAQGFGAIADFRIEHEDPADHIRAKGMAFLDMPIDSASHINETQLATFVAWVEERRAEGRPVYIHCTNGWHRAAAFAVAWRMASTNASFDEASRAQVSARPGTVMRATSGMLDYEASLRSAPQLAVVLVSNITRPEPNGTMDAHVDVVAGGAPAVGAQVRVWSEESKLRLEGVTDASGRFTFSYTAPRAGTFMDHVYARASAEGFHDGADNIEFLFGEPARARGPLEVVVMREDGDLVVEASSGGRPVASRVIVSAPGWTAFEASVEGRARFADVPADAITARVIAWGAEYGSADVPAVALPPPPPDLVPVEPPVVRPPPVDPPVSQPPPDAGAPPVEPEPAPQAGRSRPMIIASAAVAALGCALYLASRRRAAS